MVVLNYGDPTDTLACLDSLERSHDLDLDIVVVDNGVEDEAHARLRAAVGRRATTIASGANLGYAAGNNLGIRRVLERGCDLVWILNPDTLVEPTTLARLRAHLQEVPDCGVVGPRILYAEGRPRIWFDGGLVDKTDAATRHLHFGRSPRSTPPTTLDVDYVTGASMLCRRELIEDIGDIPDHYFLYLEEVDWCLRAQRAGWRTMTDQRARMWHHKRSSGLLPQPYYLYYMTRNRFLFAEDCLGVEGEVALSVLDEQFLHPWRRKVQRAAPHWLETFDEIVTMAKADGRAGHVGRRRHIHDIHPPRRQA